MNHAMTGCRGGFAASTERHYPPNLSLEPKALDIRLDLDVPNRSAAGCVEIRVGANRKDASRILLDAVDFRDLLVASGDGHPLAFRYDGSSIAVTWEKKFELDEMRTIRISYRVVDPVSGLLFDAPDKADRTRAAWVATDHETERARYWLPCIDHPSVRTPVTFHLTAPSEFEILANGILTGEEEKGDGMKTAHWQLDHPCPSYLICFAAGEFVRVEEEGETIVPTAYFGAKGRATKEQLERTFGRTPKMMAWLEKRLGRPFPFPKYYQFALPRFAGAMENISLVSWTDVVVQDAVSEPVGQPRVDLVNLHEMAHSYFGDSVVIRDFAHAWLKESFATYMESCWLEATEGVDAFHYQLHLEAREYMEEADGKYERPIVTRRYDSSWDMFDRHLYPGGAWRIQMLRREVGEEVFWPAVSSYLEAFAGKVADTDDFRRVVERHAARPLGAFFDQWFYEAGYPRIEAAFNHSDETGYLTITQKTRHDKDDAPPFRFPLTIAWEETDGTFRTKTFQIGRQRQELAIPMPERPLQVVIDPEGCLLKKLRFTPDDSMLRRTARTGRTVPSRIWAVEELARSGRLLNLEALREAWLSEPFFGVRHAAAAALANCRSLAAGRLLRDLFDHEKDLRVKVRMVQTIGDLRAAEFAPFLKEIAASEGSYHLQAAALIALGKQRTFDPLLEKAANDQGHRGLVRSGALTGLAETRSEEAFPLLLARVGYGNETDDAARTAATALAELGRFMPERLQLRAMEALVGALSDPREPVKETALGALETLGRKEAVEAIEASRAHFPAQEQAKILRVVKALRETSGKGASTVALDTRIEALEQTVAKLQDRLDRFEQT